MSTEIKKEKIIIPDQLNIIIRTSLLEKAGYITKTERKYLNEIYQFNPLLFDF